MNVRIGLAKRDEALSIANLSRVLIEDGLPWSWTPSRVERCIHHPDTCVIVARDRNLLVGFAIMEFHDADAHLSLFAVRPGYRQRGLGRRLLEWLESSARTAGVFSVRLELRASNQSAYAFYTKLGYTEFGRRPGYYSGREDAVQMRRDLSVQAAPSV